MLSVEDTGSSECAINHWFYYSIRISLGKDEKLHVFNGLRQHTT